MRDNMKRAEKLSDVQMLKVLKAILDEERQAEDEATKQARTEWMLREIAHILGSDQ